MGRTVARWGQNGDRSGGGVWESNPPNDFLGRLSGFAYWHALKGEMGLELGKKEPLFQTARVWTMPAIENSGLLPG